MRISRRAIDAGFREFLLVGGNAMIVYGIPRNTRDVDFLIPVEDELRWRTFLETCGYRFGHRTAGFSQFFAEPEGAPRLDLMLVDRSTWKKLEADAERMPITDDLDLRLPAPRHLIAMKLRAAISPSRINAQQDWSDIVELMIRNQFDLDDTGIRDLVIKFGGESAIEILRTLLNERRSD